MSQPMNVPLTKSQKEIMDEFYKVKNTRVLLTKLERDVIWKGFKASRVIPENKLQQSCPALLAELNKAINNVNLIQSAIFSECVYAQTLANMLKLSEFYIFSDSPNCLDKSVINLISSYNLVPRYIYKSSDGRRALVQAGGPGGTDSALIQVEDNHVFTIEFKEAGAKTSEPDLPAYGEDGFLISTREYESTNSQFKSMIEEQIKKRLNFWEVMGSNVNDFDPLNVQIAVTENYASKKYADVICVEDINSYLTMIPANQAIHWANIRGEIRPAGRNKYSVWTPNKLVEFIIEMGGRINGSNVVIALDKLGQAKRRGGNDDVNRYKINSIFFIYARDLVIKNGEAYFKIDDVYQLKPTISAHMFFRELEIDAVRNKYGVGS
jgi:hypothetical protein